MKDWPGWEVWLVECGWPKLGEFLRFDLVSVTLKCLRVFSYWMDALATKSGRGETN